MNDDELDALRAGVEGATSGALKPIHDIIVKLAGPAAEEIGLTWRDQVRVWRLSRALRLAKRVEALLASSSMPTTGVPLKVLLPSFEYASLEDNNYLQDHWASLLAHSAAAGQYADATPMFVEMLKQLSTMDVKFLDKLYEHADGPESDLGSLSSLQDVFFEAVNMEHGINDINAYTFRISYYNVIRLGVLRAVRRTMERDFLPSMRDDLEETMENRYHFTDLGYAFVGTCHPAPPGSI